MEASAAGRRWAERWVRFHAPMAMADVAYGGARARADRYPSPVGDAWGRAAEIVDRFAPTLALGRAVRASELDDDGFDRLEVALQYHASPVVRALYMLMRAPLLEQVYADDEPRGNPGHPLLQLRDRIRESTALGRDRFDVIVIGSGAGGAPIAWSLARRGLSVAVIESGGLLVADNSHRVLETHFLDQGMLGSISKGGTTLVLAGRALGGTTVINSGTSFRPKQECLEEWDRLSGTRFADGLLDPWLDQVDSRLGIAPIPDELLDASSVLVRKGLEKIGRPDAFPLPRNAPACQGASRCCYGCPTGAKLSTDRSYLPEAVERGVALFAEATAHGVRETRDGVEVFVDTRDGRRRLRAKELVIAAGALGTPAILRGNRLGTHWQEAGDHLKIHPATKILAMMPDKLPHGGVPQALGYRAPELPRVTFEGAHMPPSMAAPVVLAAGSRHKWWMDRYERAANYGLMVRDRSWGTIRTVAGRKVLTYALHDEDARDAATGLKIAAEAFFAMGAERVQLPLAGRSPEFGSLAELRALNPADIGRKDLLMTGFHPQGTAGIGRVVDADLRLFGTDHVHVADASVFPDSPGVNPQVTIMALALRLADVLATRF